MPVELVESVFPADVGAAKHHSGKACPLEGVFQPPVAFLNVESGQLGRRKGQLKRHDVRHHQLFGRVGLLKDRDESFLGGNICLLERSRALGAGKGSTTTTGPAVVELVGQLPQQPGKLSVSGSLGALGRAEGCQ